MRPATHIAAVFGLAVICSSAQAASQYSVNITELSDTDIQASVVFPGFTFSGDITTAGGEIWTLLNSQNYSPGVVSKLVNPDGTVFIYNQIAWREPGESTFNWFDLGYNGNTGTEGMFVASDLTAADLDNGPFGVGSFSHDCILGALGQAACPILDDGETITIPLMSTGSPGDPLGFMDVTFTDEGDVASPEPGSLSLFGVALFSLATALSRYRSRKG
jgi:hypothetical protein